MIVWLAILVFQNLFSQALRGFQDIRLYTLFGGTLSALLLLLTLLERRL